jgi:hypothetical protein
MPEKEMRELIMNLLCDEYGISEDAYEILAKHMPEDIERLVEEKNGRFFVAPECRSDLEEEV